MPRTQETVLEIDLRALKHNFEYLKSRITKGAKLLVVVKAYAYGSDANQIAKYLEKLDVVPNLVLSTNWEMRLPLRWIAILYSHIKANMAATSGIHSYEDVLKVMMAGGDVAMVCSELLTNGVGRITEMLTQLENWMDENEYDSIEMMQGSMSQKAVQEPAAFERANYMKALQSYRTTLI